MTENESKRYGNVSLNRPLYEAVQKFVKDHPEYRGVADFVSEATRLRMQSLTRLMLRLKQCIQVGMAVGKGYKLTAKGLEEET